MNQLRLILIVVYMTSFLNNPSNKLTSLIKTSNKQLLFQKYLSDEIENNSFKAYQNTILVFFTGKTCCIEGLKRLVLSLFCKSCNYCKLFYRTLLALEHYIICLLESYLSGSSADRTVLNYSVLHDFTSDSIFFKWF